jgi:hypothetical protein
MRLSYPVEIHSGVMKGREHVDDNGQGSFAHKLDGRFQEIYRNHQR